MKSSKMKKMYAITIVLSIVLGMLTYFCEYVLLEMTVLPKLAPKPSIFNNINNTVVHLEATDVIIEIASCLALTLVVLLIVSNFFKKNIFSMACGVLTVISFCVQIPLLFNYENVLNGIIEWLCVSVFNLFILMAFIVASYFMLRVKKEEKSLSRLEKIIMDPTQSKQERKGRKKISKVKKIYAITIVLSLIIGFFVWCYNSIDVMRVLLPQISEEWMHSQFNDYWGVSEEETDVLETVDNVEIRYSMRDFFDSESDMPVEDKALSMMCFVLAIVLFLIVSNLFKKNVFSMGCGILTLISFCVQKALLSAYEEFQSVILKEQIFSVLFLLSLIAFIVVSYFMLRIKKEENALSKEE